MRRRFLACGLVLALLLTLSSAGHGDGKPGAKLPAAPTNAGLEKMKKLAGIWLAAGKDVKGLALVGASWARYCAGKTDSGAEIAPNDPNWERLQTFARKAEHDPEAFLAMDEIFGPIAKDRRYVSAFVEAYRLLKNRGTKEALAAYVG